MSSPSATKVLFLVSAVAISIVAAKDNFLGDYERVDPKVGAPISAMERAKISGLRTQISDKTCDFYDKFDQIFDYCGSTGYVQGFGHKYCDQYLAHRSDFKIVEWQDAVRACL